MATLTSSNKFFNIAMGSSTTIGSVGLTPGTIYFCTDTNQIHFDLLDGSGRNVVNAYYAEQAGAASSADTATKLATDIKVETAANNGLTLVASTTTLNSGSNLGLTIGISAKGIQTASLADSAVTTAKIASKAVTNAKIANPYVTIGGEQLALGGTISSAALTQLRTDLGLSSALRFVGTTSTQLTDGYTDTVSGVSSPQAGDVVIVESTAKEFIYVNQMWREFGDGSGYMTTLSSTYTKGASANGSSITVLTGIKQATNGAITAYTGTIPDATTSSKGVASFNSTHFAVSSGAVSLNLSGDWAAPKAKALNTPLVITVADNSNTNTVTHEENDLSSGALTLKLPATIKATLSGNATTATTATKLSTSAGSTTLPVYFTGGKPAAVAAAGTNNPITIDITGNAGSADGLSAAVSIKVGQAEGTLQEGGKTIEFANEDIGSTVVWSTWS